jgi:hypothetical protein
LLQTWFNYAPNEIYIVTDTADTNITRQIGWTAGCKRYIFCAFSSYMF